MCGNAQTVVPAEHQQPYFLGTHSILEQILDLEAKDKIWTPGPMAIGDEHLLTLLTQLF